jgi:U3 small nucleolar RNA-associated protein 7
MKRFLRKKTKNIIDERRLRMEALRKKEREEREGKTGGKEKKLPPVLARFEKKSN